ncbi:uncharacterized protein LOC143178947 [Calliopsis andreniformis]|uniref:uncharacterized protein LOC143178947 n=1 Tax=Calliopsis andreniformis TaxID=337506 RepID=UPI003FCE2CDC
MYRACINATVYSLEQQNEQWDRGLMIDRPASSFAHSLIGRKTALSSFCHRDDLDSDRGDQCQCVSERAEDSEPRAAVKIYISLDFDIQTKFPRSAASMTFILPFEEKESKHSDIDTVSITFVNVLGTRLRLQGLGSGIDKEDSQWTTEVFLPDLERARPLVSERF